MCASSVTTALKTAAKLVGPDSDCLVSMFLSVINLREVWRDVFASVAEQGHLLAVNNHDVYACVTSISFSKFKHHQKLPGCHNFRAMRFQ